MRKTVFVKYSNERSEEFSIRTEIYLKDSVKMVKKTPCTKKAERHVKNIYHWSKELGKVYKSKGLKINYCELTDDGVEMEYLEGQTLEELLDSYIESKEYDKLETFIDEYFDILSESAQEEFQPTEEFEKVFGIIPEFDNQKSAVITDIDMVLNNIIICQGWNLIDYEWTFDFPVPVEYVIYRVLHYYFETTGARNEVLNDRKIYERYGLTEEKRRVYAEMEKNFQQYLIQGYEPLRMMYQKITPGIIPIGKAIDLYRQQMWGSLQVFWSADGIIREEDSKRFFPMDGRTVSCIVEFPQRIKCIRMDPGEGQCTIQINRFCVNGKELTSDMYWTNGFQLESSLYIFPSEDPNVLYKSEDDIRTLELEWAVIPLTKELTEAVRILGYKWQEQEEQIRVEQKKNALLQEKIVERDEIIQQKNQVIEQKKSLIREMENTKVWKIYRKYRQLRERKKE